MSDTFKKNIETAIDEISVVGGSRNWVDKNDTGRAGFHYDFAVFVREQEINDIIERFYHMLSQLENLPKYQKNLDFSTFR
jgi:hypothetical protein